MSSVQKVCDNSKNHDMDGCLKADWSKPSKESSDMTLTYRPNVGIMIINRDKKVWIGLRSDADKYPECCTQMPQGGIDLGETPVQAAWREMYEETGLTPKTAVLITQLKQWLHYDFPPYIMGRVPKGFKGQCQKWFLFLLTGTDQDFNLHAYKKDEFSKFMWMDLKDVPDHVIDFKQNVYRQVVQEFESIIQALDTRSY